MSNVVTITGSLVAGPPQASDTAFPSGVTQIAFATQPTQKPAQVQTGAQVRQVQSPTVFVPLDGVGTGETLTQGTTLYVRVIGPMRLRATFADTPLDVVSELPAKGLLVFEVDEAHPLKLLEAKGSGTVEYFISGNL